MGLALNTGLDGGNEGLYGGNPGIYSGSPGLVDPDDLPDEDEEDT